MTKKVSVIIPAYNKADLTVKTVESVLGQTYENIEIIVVDDGSTDDTARRMASFGDKIRYIRKENGGACSARNLGIRSAQGDYLAFLDCDDAYLPQKIEKSVKYFEKYPDTVFVYTRVYFTNGDGNILGKYPRFKRCPSGNIGKDLLLHNFVCNSTVVVKRPYFDKTSFFDETIFHPADWDMWIRLAEKGKAGYIPEALTLLYKPPERYSDDYLVRSIKESFFVLEKAFKRNTKSKMVFRKKCFSNIHFAYALGYLRLGDYKKSKNELILAIGKNRFNIKALFLITAMAAFGRHVRSGLRYVDVF